MKRAAAKTSLLFTLVIISVVALMFFFTSCSTQPGDEIAEAPALEPTAAPPTATDEPTSTPEATIEVPTPAAPDTCFDCHTDKDLLIQVADPEEEVISENEGEG